MRQCVLASLIISVAALTISAWGQSPTATVNGIVRDSSGAVVPGADVQLINEHTNVKYPAKTNAEGIYWVSNLPPGTYRIQVSKIGFKTIVKPDIILNVLDARGINFDLPVGAVSETVTVEGGASLVNTESASVSTVVDRQFAENLPMNGRSFQTLIQLTPGVVLMPANLSDNGQFSVNGQRASSNYWMVDGVSANIGVGVNVFGLPGGGLGGTLGSFSASGGTNSLVSVDAMQEFRIQTSTYAPEFGRTPGGQISIVTRSGTNQLHGTAFDYFRNDMLDANDWFAAHKGQKKPEERQNDFGGTVGGPLQKNRTFFFFSYEGLRLRLPQFAQTTVPGLDDRKNALPAVQPFLSAYPLPNGPQALDAEGNLIPGAFQFNSSFSNRSTLDAYSLRIDHKLNSEITVFGRYNYSPSETVQRGNANSLSDLFSTRITTQTATIGATWGISPTVSNDLHFNYSRTNASSHFNMDNFGGAIPLTSLPFPSPFTEQNAQFQFGIFPLQQGTLQVGQNQRNLQRQINVVESLSVQKGSHSLKLGVDFRRLSPLFEPFAYLQGPFFSDVPSAENGNLFGSVVQSASSPTFLFRNLGIYAQDTWRVVPRLALTYGLRWDVDFAPQSLSGPAFPAVKGFDLNDLSNLALAPLGTPPYKTTYGNFAPRLGVAYQLVQSQDWQTVIRGGFGVFYDLATSEAGNNFGLSSYPFGNFKVTFGGAFPLDPATAAPPPITPPSISNPQALFAFNPNLMLPYTLEWNIALEQGLGRQQSISASYVGATGRRLLQTASISPPPEPSFSQAILVTNAGTSDYSALQLQFQRRLWHGLEALASYTWSHSIDTGSAGSTAVAGNLLIPSAINANRGPSSFDIRSALSTGVTYEIPAPKVNAFGGFLLRGWSVESVVQVFSAPPVDVYYSFFQLGNNVGAVRPDIVSGEPFYLYGTRYPGGKAFNVAAFTPPPSDPNTGAPLRQGNLGRNALRGFGAAQWDFAVHRDFPIYESLKLEFRAEMFNVLNHPNFGAPVGDLQDPASPNPQFGQSIQMLGRSLDQNPGGGSFSALYQIGGPRSIQFGLKFVF
jgi:hypothetical protein